MVARVCVTTHISNSSRLHRSEEVRISGSKAYYCVANLCAKYLNRFHTYIRKIPHSQNDVFPYDVSFANGHYNRTVLLMEFWVTGNRICLISNWLYNQLIIVVAYL